MRRRRFTRIGPFSNPKLVDPVASPDTISVFRMALDFDDLDSLRKFYGRYRKVSHLFPDFTAVVERKKNGEGYHILFLFSEPMSLRDNLAIRLYLFDDPRHVAYDLFTSLYAPTFPTNVLFTRKVRSGKGSEYEEVCMCSKSNFLRLLTRFLD